jgi:hypothetical protein
MEQVRKRLPLFWMMSYQAPRMDRLGDKVARVSLDLGSAKLLIGSQPSPGDSAGKSRGWKHSSRRNEISRLTVSRRFSPHTRWVAGTASMSIWSWASFRAMASVGRALFPSECVGAGPRGW